MQSYLNQTQKTARTLGFKLFFTDRSVSGLLSQKTHILDCIQNHGAICIKNVDFNQKDMVQFTKGMYDEIIQLPAFLCFNNQPLEYKQIARVGNINADGTMKDSQKQAAYWHQDGDFWGQGNKHIFNNLHTRQIPEIGGQTHILDLVEGANFLKINKPLLYNRLKELQGVLKLEEIKDFQLYNATNVLNIESVTYHNLISTCEKTKREKLFLSVQRFIQKGNGQVALDATKQQVLQILEEQMGFYIHKWQKGDILIYDDVQVMHRSSGSFKGRRLLFRTQGRFK